MDQDGREVRFYSDLVRGKLVMMNAIFTRCPATCPVQAGIFARVQEQLGDRLKRDVRLISVSLDPVYDTPERLREFGRRHGAGPGWRLLTGSKENVTTVLKAMDLYAANPADHTPIAAIGNEPGGVWIKALHLVSPLELVKKLEYVAALDLEKVAHSHR
jgi:protein SCO1/2